MRVVKNQADKNQDKYAILEKLIGQLRGSLLEGLSQPLNTKMSTSNVQLTKRELECLCLTAEGKNVSEIAFVLSRKPSTIESHLKNVRQKFGVKKIQHAAILAIKQGIIT